jgi:hypothetical protein
MDKIFAEGMFFNKPREGAPDFVKGKIDIKVDEFLLFLNKNKNQKGYVNLDLKESKGGKLYLELNTFVPKDMQDRAEHMDFEETHGINPNDLF